MELAWDVRPLDPLQQKLIVVSVNVRLACVYCGRCTWIMSRNDDAKRFTPRDQEQMVSSVIEPMASDGLRTICLAYKDYVPG